MGIVKELIDRASNGLKEDVDYLMSLLTDETELAMTRFVDYALSFVKSEEGVERMEFYLFNGTLIQRNYCALYFNRKDDWKIVQVAYKQGLVDEIQTFAR